MARDKTDKTDKTPAATFATTATWAANEWGIPDWQDAAAYGDTKQWTFDRWRWEFYRRREDLREYFDARAEETFQHWQPYAGKEGFPAAHRRPDEPGFCAIVDVEARKRFGYSGLPNPRIGEQPASAISPWDGDPKIHGMVRYIEQDEHSTTLKTILASVDVNLTNEQRFLLGHFMDKALHRLESDEIAIIFDYNKPLEPQLESARVKLQNEYKFHGKPRQTKTNPHKWFEYLRTLDAKEDGASLREIAVALLPMREDEAGEQVHARETKARDTCNAADALRFNF